MIMPEIIGNKVPVVETDRYVIEEFVGNVATPTNDDADNNKSSSLPFSMAHVTVKSDPKVMKKEPWWLTIHYTEWISVIQGCLELECQSDGRVVTIQAGQTAKILPGETFRPRFPPQPHHTIYVPICQPAFRPDLCIRQVIEEDQEGAKEQQTETTKDDKKEEQERIDARLEELHTTAPTTTTTTVEVPEIVYHMCEKTKWEEACAKQEAYFPPTFAQDGNFTHATAVPERLIDTANHFYTSSQDSWICLQLNTKVLKQHCGIVTVMEEAKPVGTTATAGADWESWQCPHIYGGIPTAVPNVMTKTFSMNRDADKGTFLSIEGLVSPSSS